MQGFKALFAIGLATLVGALSGCGGGGGDDSGSVTRTFAGRTITAPAPPTTTGSQTGSTATGTLPQAITIPGAGTIPASELAPFRACLRRHGVEPLELDSGQATPGTFSADQVARLRAQIRQQLPARTACAPELPTALRDAFEQFRKRFQGAGR
jgi:hypothetical protein